MLVPEDLTFRVGEDVNVKPGGKEAPLREGNGRKILGKRDVGEDKDTGKEGREEKRGREKKGRE